MTQTQSILELLSVTVIPTELRFQYSVRGVRFCRSLSFPEDIDLTQWEDDTTFKRLVRYCALADSVYMYNFDYFDRFVVPFAVTQDEKDFFEKAYYHGLAEFRYTNDIELTRSVVIDGPIEQLEEKVTSTPTDNTAFVLNGGGKDGAVAMEIVRAIGLDVTWLSVGSAESRDGIVAASGVQDSFMLRRGKDESTELERIYEGHKPMSLYVAMAAALSAYINRRQYVISANEYSASFPNLTVDGIAINHQYSKSFEFEINLCRLFEAHGIPVRYFSIVRPLYEIQIMKIFSRYDKYHDVFISCNNGIHHGEWCLACAKCAFVVGSMYYFASDKAAKKWGPVERLYAQHPRLVDETIELVNPQQKPFECVGVTEENRLLVDVVLSQLVLMENQTARYKDYIKMPVPSIDIAKPMPTNDFPEELAADISRTIEEML